MSERADETTVDRTSDAGSPSRSAASTEELLEETERLLDGAGAGGGSEAASASAGAEPGLGSESGATSDSDSDSESGSVLDLNVGLGGRSAEDADGRSWLPSFGSGDSTAQSRSRTGAIRSKVSPSQYFSPKAFLGFVLAIGVGLVGGGLALPSAGRMLGMFAITFLLGLALERRRYAELTAAGVSVGAASALANHAILAFAGSSQTIAAVGATAGLLACLVGYYLGRDLRHGLVGDLD